MKKVLGLLAILLLASFQTQAAPNYLQAPTPRQHGALAPVAVSSIVTSATAFAANPSRTSLVCTNTGSATVYLAFGANAAVSGSGIAVTAGTTWWMDDYSFTTQAIQIIGISTLACQEFQ
jgi:hypothetical protein